MFKKIHILMGCFILLIPGTALAQLDLTVAGDNAAKTRSSTPPASFAYTFNENGEDSYAIHAAVNAGLWQLGTDSSMTANVLWHRTNQERREQNNFSTGLSFRRLFGHDSTIGTTDLFDVVGQVAFSYNRTGVFVNKLPPACNGTPSLPQCDTQYKESFRTTLTAQPSHERWLDCLSALEMGCEFTTSVALVYDEMLDNVVSPATGSIVDGSLVAGRFQAGLSITDRLEKPHFRLSANVQWIERLSASDARSELFPRSSELYTASLSYILLDTSQDRGSTSSIFTNPMNVSFGLEYRNGADPLRGRSEQETLTLALRFLVKSS